MKEPYSAARPGALPWLKRLATERQYKLNSREYDDTAWAVKLLQAAWVLKAGVCVWCVCAVRVVFGVRGCGVEWGSFSRDTTVLVFIII